MILHPAMLALLTGAGLLTLFCLHASWVGIGILRSWNLNSGSEAQLVMERKTYLVSTILGHLLVFECASLFLYVLTAEQLHTQFTGAMCAAGSFAASPFGYPALRYKLVNCVLCGFWLVLNHADQLGFDYPLIRKKFALLLPLTLLILRETYLLFSYGMTVQGDVVTSCCGMLFGDSGSGVGADLAALPPRLSMIVFYVVSVLLIAVGFLFLLKRRGAAAYGWLSLVFFVVSLLAMISFVSPYVYALPTHHCPFCLLQGEYYYIGYPMYLALLVGVVTGIGAGWLNRYRRVSSLSEALPLFQTRLCRISLVAFGVFILIATASVIFSPLQLF